MPPESEAKVGYAWIIAPPFVHIDLTVTRQKQNEDIREFMPLYIITKDVGPAAGVRLEDMADSDWMSFWMRRSGSMPTIHELMNQNEKVARYMTRFRPFSVSVGSATLKNFPCRHTAAQEAFEKHTGHCFSGRTTPAVLKDMVAVIGTPEEIGFLT